MDKIDKFVEKRKQHIKESGEESSIEHFNSLRSINKKPYYVTCTDCTEFDEGRYYCYKLKTDVDYRIVPYGCGDGEIMPF